MGPRACLEMVVNRKIQDSKPPIICPIAQHYTTELSWLLLRMKLLLKS
jgi:hypothetical protein